MVDLIIQQTLYPNQGNSYFNLDIENKNDLFTFTIQLTTDYKLISIYVNYKKSICDMFPQFNRSLDIKIPKTIINLLLPQHNKTKATLGYNLLTNYIKNNDETNII